jgi:hypothetical protein
VKLRDRNIDPGQMPALSGARIQKDRATTGGVVEDRRAAIRATIIVATINSQTLGYAIDPRETALGIPVQLGATGRLAVEGTGEKTVGAHGVFGQWRRKHGGVEAAMDKEFVSGAEPSGRSRDVFDGTDAQFLVQLIEGDLEIRVDLDSAAGQRACKLMVMVAEEEKPLAGIDARKHEAEGTRAVRSAIREVTKLDDEAVGLQRMRKGTDITVDVAYDTQGSVWGNNGDQVSSSL